MSGVLLDTCAAIWLGNGDRMSSQAIDGIHAAAEQRRLVVSTISAWEIGLIARSRKGERPFDPDPASWFRTLLTAPGMMLEQLSFEAAIDASFLPGDFHKDPADRLLVATARLLNLPLVTRDERILRYAEQGHLNAIGC